jgi:hypothetical protein
MRRAAALLGVLVLTALYAATASADPTNANGAIYSFACDNGVTFNGVATFQSHTATGHVVTASDPSLVNSVFQAKYVTVNGTVLKTTPGFEGRTLVNCTVTAMGGQPVSDDIVFTGFFTPASR